MIPSVPLSKAVYLVSRKLHPVYSSPLTFGYGGCEGGARFTTRRDFDLLALEALKQRSLINGSFVCKEEY
jgi:hypothetical protein